MKSFIDRLIGAVDVSVKLSVNEYSRVFGYQYGGVSVLIEYPHFA